MFVYAGIDEAGYGPLLGPLVIGRAVLVIPKLAHDAPTPDLWLRLGKAVCKRISDRAGRIAINDSKKLTTKAAGIRHLELGCLAFDALRLGPEHAFGSLGDWDVRRFRTNVVVTGEGEDELVGSTVRLGDAELEVTKRISRCVMVTRPQPGLDRDLAVLKAVNAERESCLSIGALVAAPGTIRVGDELTVR